MGTTDMKLEVVVIHVSGLDRAAESSGAPSGGLATDLYQKNAVQTYL
jgi:hypothetical protein